jgi:iron-sulfur cluster assembly protein
MLTLTTNAADTIRALVDGSEIPDAGGLRIAKDPAAGALALSLAAVPAEDDQVVEAAGARLFLEPEAAVILEDKTLDATSDAEGRVQFGLTKTAV